MAQQNRTVDQLQDPLMVDSQYSAMDEILDETQRIVLLERCLHPLLFLYGLLVIPGHGSDSALLNIAPFVAEVGTIYICNHWQWRIFDLIRQWAHRNDVHPQARIALKALDEPYMVFGAPFPASRLVVGGVLNITAFWSGVATSMVAGQSFGLWSKALQEPWVSSWLEVPLFGPSLARVFTVMSIPVLLTILALFSYVKFLCYDFTDQLQFCRKFNSRDSPKPFSCDIGTVRPYCWVPWKCYGNATDLGNLALLSVAAFEFADQFSLLDSKIRAGGYRGVDDRTGRFRRIAFVSGPHLWLKVSLFALSYRNISAFNAVNMLLPVLLTFYTKGVTWPTALRRALAAGNGLRNDCFFWIAPLLVSAFFFLASAMKLAGVFLCSESHVLNITSGCVAAA